MPKSFCDSFWMHCMWHWMRERPARNWSSTTIYRPIERQIWPGNGIRKWRIQWSKIYSWGNWRVRWNAPFAAMPVKHSIHFGISVCRCPHPADANWKVAWICLSKRKCSMATKCQPVRNAKRDENVPRHLRFNVFPNIWSSVSTTWLPPIDLTRPIVWSCAFHLENRFETIFGDALEQIDQYCRISDRRTWTQYGAVRSECIVRLLFIIWHL